MLNKKNNNNLDLNSTTDQKKQLQYLTDHLHFLLVKKQSKINFINKMNIEKCEVSPSYKNILQTLTDEIATTKSQIESILKFSKNLNLSSMSDYENEYKALIEYLCNHDKNKAAIKAVFWDSKIRQDYPKFQQWLKEIKPLIESNKKSISNNLNESEKLHHTYVCIPNASDSVDNTNKFLENQYQLLVNLDRIAARSVTMDQIEMLSKNQQYLTSELCAKLQERYVGKFNLIPTATLHP